MIILTALRVDMLGKFHNGHLGLVLCRQLAQKSIWWPNLRHYLEE